MFSHPSPSKPKALEPISKASVFHADSHISLAVVLLLFQDLFYFLKLCICWEGDDVHRRVGPVGRCSD